MKAITLAKYQKINFGYDFYDIKIAFCTAPNKNGQIRVVKYFDPCRETVCSLLRDQLDDDHKVKYTIDTKKTRLLFFSKASNNYTERSIKNFASKSNRQMLNALKIANHLESRYNWARTKMQKVEFKNKIPYGTMDIKDRINMYMVVGSSKWLKSPHLLSLYMLIFRLGYRGFKSNFKNHEEFLQRLNAYANTQKVDAYYVRTFQDKIDVLLGNYNRLFGKRTLKSLYSRKLLINNTGHFESGYNEGIQRLCTGFSNDMDISRRFGKICEENNIEYQVKHR